MRTIRSRECPTCGVAFQTLDRRQRFCSFAHRRRAPLVDRYWARVVKSDGCWGWTGATTRGYGTISDYSGSGRTLTAHRFSWQLHHGDIPDGLQVLHRCDNPACTNPEHLFLGTQLDNMRDMQAKGRGGDRAKYGVANGRAVLIPAWIEVIRASDAPATALAAAFGVSPSTIRRARRGNTWQR